MSSSRHDTGPARRVNALDEVEPPPDRPRFWLESGRLLTTHPEVFRKNFIVPDRDPSDDGRHAVSLTHAETLALLLRRKDTP